MIQGDPMLPHWKANNPSFETAPPAAAQQGGHNKDDRNKNSPCHHHYTSPSGHSHNFLRP